MSVEGFERCVRTEDSATLVKIPGVGKKTAERLIIEMRDRLEGAAVTPIQGSVQTQDSRGEAFDALVALGYKPAEVKRLLGDAGEQSTEELIRHALRQAVN